ncbi:MAG TPA: hypothetical protein VJA16_13225, partial [Thermoanaerobaculia bacterium]
SQSIDRMDLTAHRNAQLLRKSLQREKLAGDKRADKGRCGLLAGGGPGEVGWDLSDGETSRVLWRMSKKRAPSTSWSRCW